MYASTLHESPSVLARTITCRASTGRVSSPATQHSDQVLYLVFAAAVTLSWDEGVLLIYFVRGQTVKLCKEFHQGQTEKYISVIVLLYARLFRLLVEEAEYSKLISHKFLNADIAASAALPSLYTQIGISCVRVRARACVCQQSRQRKPPWKTSAGQK